VWFSVAFYFLTFLPLDLFFLKMLEQFGQKAKIPRGTNCLCTEVMKLHHQARNSGCKMFHSYNSTPSSSVFAVKNCAGSNLNPCLP
jgi:hypothetical protein